MAEKEYIEREALINKIHKRFRPDTKLSAVYLVGLIGDEPTADVQEVRHGEWLPTNHPEQKRCSVCDVISFIALYPCINKADYCPHCGAKMDKE